MSEPPHPKKRKVQVDHRNNVTENFRLEFMQLIDPRWFEHYIGKRKRQRITLLNDSTNSTERKKKDSTETSDEISGLYGKQFAHLTENEKLKVLFSLKSPGERQGITQCLNKVHFSLLRKIFRKYVEERVLSKRNIIQSLSSKFFGETPDFEKRNLERSNLEEVVDHIDFRFKRLCNVLIPRHVLLRIFSFLDYSRNMLVRVGSVCKMFYVTILSSWPRVKVYKRTLYQISLLVLKSVQKLSLFELTRSERFIRLELDYLWNNVCPSRLRSLTIYTSLDEIKRLFNDLLRRKRYISGEIEMSPNSKRKRRRSSSTSSSISNNNNNNQKNSSKTEYCLQHVTKLKFLTKSYQDPQTYHKAISYDWSPSRACPNIIDVLPNIQTVINPMKLEMLDGSQLKHVGLTIHGTNVDPQYDLFSVEKFRKYVWKGTKILTLNVSRASMKYLEGLVMHLSDSLVELIISITDFSSPSFDMYLFTKIKNLERLSLLFADCTCGEVRGSRHGTDNFDHMKLKKMRLSPSCSLSFHNDKEDEDYNTLNNNSNNSMNHGKNNNVSSSYTFSSRKIPNFYFGVRDLCIDRSAVSCVEFSFGIIIRSAMLWDPKLKRFFGRCMAMENDPKLLDEALRMMTLFIRERIGSFEVFDLMIDCQLAYPEGISKGQYRFRYSGNGRRLNLDYLRLFDCNNGDSRSKPCFLPCVTIFEYFNHQLRELEDCFDSVIINAISRRGKVFKPPKKRNSLLPETEFVETKRRVTRLGYSLSYARKSKMVV